MTRTTALQSAVAAALFAAIAAPATVALAQSEELTIGLASEPTSIDPHFHNLTTNNQLAHTIFDSLVRQGPQQQLLPGLATRWQAVDDLTWEFTLREGVTFHDGSPFTADDVVCSFERAASVPNSPSSFSLYTADKSVEKVDDTTVRITTADPMPLMANDVATIAIVSNETGCRATTGEFDSGAAAIGTGPYQFAAYVPGERIALEAYEDAWDGAPQFRTVTLTPLPSDAERARALLAGDVDMISDVPPAEIARLRGDEDVRIAEATSNRIIYLHLDQFRQNSPHVAAKDGATLDNPLRDVRVRQAISKAIDREAIASDVMEGDAIPAGQLLPEGFFGTSDALEPVARDPEGAKKLLEEAGYADGWKMTLHGPNDRYVNDAEILAAIAEMLTDIGIETEVATMPRTTFFTRASRGGPDETPEFSVILVGWAAGTGEASSPLRALVHTDGAANRGGYSNSAVDAKIDLATRTVDAAEREALLAEATEIAIEDGAIIPIHFQRNVWAMRKGLEYQPRADGWTLPQAVTQAE